MKNAIILCSGGIDSVTTAYYVRKKLNYQKTIILFFNYKQKTLKQERNLSKKCAKNIKAEDLADALNSSRDIIEKRVNFFGVSEPTVSTIKSGSKYRISVDLLGIDKVDEAIERLKQKGDIFEPKKGFIQRL